MILVMLLFLLDMTMDSYFKFFNLIKILNLLLRNNIFLYKEIKILDT